MKRVVLSVVAVLVAVAIWALVRGPAPAKEGVDNHPVTGSSAKAEQRNHRGDAAADVRARPKAGVQTRRRVSDTERKKLREKIVQGLKARARAKAKSAVAPSEAIAERDADEGGEGGGEITDRTDGELKAFVVAFNEDVMPLVDECYELAREEDPTLIGMLDLNVELIADEEVGTLVESVSMGVENEITNASMNECISETLLSTAFPAVGDSGSEGVRLTLRFEPT